ncbi:MAG: alpha/beta hydrolase [Dehalococcoidia bacterium]
MTSIDLPSGWTDNYAEVNGIRLHYVRAGDRANPPLFLVHGWPGWWYEWHHNIGPLADHFDVVVPDMRGYAYSDKPDASPAEGYTPMHFAEDLRQLIGHLGCAKVNIATHDFGGVWVQRLAYESPDLIEKLALFDPPYPGIGGRWFEGMQRFQVWYQFFHQLQLAEDLVGSSRKATEVYLRHFLDHWSGRGGVWTDEEIEHYVEAYSQPGAIRGGFNCYRAVYSGAHPWEGDTVIRIPTLVLWGEKDSILPSAWADNIPDYFPNSTLKILPELGHFMMREDPERINAELIEFFEPT